MDKKMSRRDFLKAGIQAVLTTTALTACGNLVAWGANGYRQGPGITVGENGLIISVAELAKQSAVSFVFAGKKSILLYNEGTIRAFENICTHKGGPTELEKNTLVCQWHGATFSPLTGERLSGPAPRGSRLTPIPIAERSGDVYVVTS